MGRASPALAAFNAGEFAPEMEGRVDIEKYPIASHIQQNFVALKQGPATFRPGTAYVQPVKNSAQKTWLVRFEFSQTQAFVIEFGGGYCRFFTNHGPELATGIAAYNGGTAYVPGGLALSGGVVYYCTAATTGNAPPNGAFWYPMSAYNGSPTTAIYEIPSPYASADLTDSLGEFTLQFLQSGDVLYITGGQAGAGPAGVGYPPYTLTRYANNPPNWRFAVYAPVDGPFSPGAPIVLNQNIALAVQSFSGGVTVGSAVTITAYGGTPFAATDVGRLLRIGVQNFNQPQWQQAKAYTAGNIVTNNGNNYQCLVAGTSGSSPPVNTSGTQSDGVCLWLYTDSNYGIVQILAVTSSSIVQATILLQLPADVVQGTYTINAISQATSAVVGTVQAVAGVGIGDSGFVIGAGGMAQINQNIYTVTAVGANSVTLSVNSVPFGAWSGGGQLIVRATLQWQLGAWSNSTEWPRAVALFKDRLCLAGKLNIWASVPGLYTSHAQDFNGVQTTDSAMNELLSGDDASNITWLRSAIILLIGTQGGEYGLDAANYSSSPLGPQNVEILRQSNWRCRPVAPLLVGTSVLYVQRAGRKVYAMDYNFYLNRYDSTDQSKFAYHITIGGLTSIVYMQEPWSLLWATRADGTLLSYTFNREDNVTAWSRHNLGGNGAAESLAVIPAPDSLRDELWLIVNRTINGQLVRSVEYMTKGFEGPRAGNPGDAQASAWYVDMGGTITQPGTTQVSVPWLIGATVSILADGGVQPQQVVPPSGILQLAAPAAGFTTVTVGLPYQGNLVPMRPEGGADVGTAQGKKKQGANLVLRLVDAGGGTVGNLSNINATTQTYQDPLGLTSQSVANAEAIVYNYTTTQLDSPPPVQSGDFPVSFPLQQNSDQDASDMYLLVQQTEPLPMTVVGLFPSYKVEESQ